LSREAIVRCSAAIASKRKRAVPAAAADVDAAATTAAGAAVAAATNTDSKMQPTIEEANLDLGVGFSFRSPLSWAVA